MRIARIATFVVAAALLGTAVTTLPASATGTTISGTVTDQTTGNGIAGASVSTQPSSVSTTTDSAGNYSILVAPGTYSVIATVAAYNSNYATVTVSTTGATANIALTAVPAQSAQDLFTRPNQSGFGTATDGHAWTNDNASANVSITSNQLAFSTSGTAVDGWMGVAYRDQVVSADVNISSGTARVLARVTGSGTWVALVVDPANDELVLYSVSGGNWSQLGFWAAAPNLAFNTSYHVRLQTVGNTVSAKEWLFSDPEPAWQNTVTQTAVTGSGVGGVGSGGSASVTSSFTEAPVTQVSGRVTDGSGQPVANATVTAGSSSATTDTTGAYSIGGLAAGTYTVSASAPNYTAGAGSSASATVSTGVSATTNLTLQYSPAPPQPPSGNSTISGAITDAANNAAIAGALVTVSGAGGGSVTTNSAGQYTMSINAGTYNVVATKSGYNSNYTAATTAVGSPATANVALTAVPALAAEDLFTRPDQSGIGTASDGHVWTDDHAIYNLGNEQIAGNQLVVQTSARATDYDAWMGYSYADQQVSVDFDCLNGLGARVLARVQGEETWIAMVAGGSGSLVLWAAKNANWTFLASAPLTVSTSTWYHAKLATIGNKVYGKVWAAGSAEPAWMVSATQSIVNGPGYGGIRTAGADTNYQNFLESSVSQISGQVTDAVTGNAISGATVSISGGAATTTDVNGLYAIGGLGAGTYNVTAAASGYNSSTQSATVGAGASASLSFSLTSTSGGGNQTYIVQDTFTRANQSGWGTASNGMAWSSGTGLSIAGNEGMVSNSPASQFETLGAATTTDGNGLVRFSLAAANDTAGLLLRESSSTGLLARYDGGGNLQLMQKTSGSWTNVAKTPVSVSAGTFYWLRFLVQGTSVSMRLWQSGTPEPSVWTWTGTTTVSGAAAMGLYAWAAQGQPVSFDNFSVASLAPPTPTLQAALTVSPPSGTAPLPVSADASASTPGANPISTYSFNFGDGTTVGPQAGATAAHTYTTNGNYTVTVTVTDTSGATSMASATASVQASPPKAALTVSPTSGTAPLAITADASASTAGTNPIASYNFSFGDGTSSGAQSTATAAHTYTTGGNFTVTVTATATDGSTGTATAAVTVTSSTIAQDSFQRANQSGWGTASNGMTWSAGSGQSIASNEGLISNSSSSQYELLGSVTCTDGNGLVRFAVAAANDTAGVILRYQTNGDMMLARYDGAGNLEFMVKSGGAWTIVSKTPVSVSTNTFYFLRFLVQGTNVSLKLWKSGTTEPSAFTWTGTSSAISAAGKVGLYGWAASGAPVSFDTFSVS